MNINVSTNKKGKYKIAKSLCLNYTFARLYVYKIHRSGSTSINMSFDLDMKFDEGEGIDLSTNIQKFPAVVYLKLVAESEGYLIEIS